MCDRPTKKKNMADQFDLGELNEAELMDSSDLQDVEFDAPPVEAYPVADFGGFDAPAAAPVGEGPMELVFCFFVFCFFVFLFFVFCFFFLFFLSSF